MKQYFHVWNLVFGGLPIPFWKLYRKFSGKRKEKCSEKLPNLKYAWEKSSENDLKQIGIKPVYLERLRYLRRMVNPDILCASLAKDRIQMITIDDDIYPYNLRNLNNHFSPIVLYVRGKFPSFDKTYISIVGTRAMTAYGEQVTENIVDALRGTNAVIVSGMARGVDTKAHQLALNNKLSTVAVLGFGLNKIPSWQYKFAENIRHNGALISEYPPDLKAEKYHFPLRNRIISGLSNTTIVIEAGERSGALITAQYAQDQGRDVLSVPGDMNRPKSKGTNRSIQKSTAQILTSPEDLFDFIDIKKPAKSLNQIYSKDQQQLINALSHPLSINELIRLTKFSPQKLTTILTELELSDCVKKTKDGNYFLS